MPAPVGHPRYLPRPIVAYARCGRCQVTARYRCVWLPGGWHVCCPTCGKHRAC